jgi:hypothetical protein
MKNKIFTLLLMLFISAAAYSQLSLRPQVGINFPSFTKEITSGQFKGNAGYQFGADLQIGSAFYFQPGLNFETSDLEIKDVGSIKLSRINIPVMVGYKFGGQAGQSFGIRIFAGPNFAFNVSSDLDTAFNDIKNKLQDFQLAGVAGAGVDLSIFFVDLGYKFGVSKLFDEDVSDGKVNYFIANAGIRIGF